MSMSMSRSPSPDPLDDQGTPAPPAPASRQAAQQQAFPNMSIFVQLLANKMALDPAYVQDLFAFLATASFMTDEMKRVELFKLATAFRTHQAIVKSQLNYTSIQAMLERVDNSMDNSTVFTAGQKTEIKNACRVIVFEATRTDYTNPAISSAVLAYLKRGRHVNGFKDYFDSPTQARTDALKSLIGTDASYVKGQFKILIRAGILGDGNTGPVSLTDNLLDGTRRFLGSSDTPSTEGGIHFIIIRAFARANPHLLTQLAKKKTHVEAEDVTSTSGEPTGTGKKRKLTGAAARGSDFSTQLTEFFSEKEDLWGDDLSAEGWTSYIDEAINNELRAHPNDPLPLIPRRLPIPAGPVMPAFNTPTQGTHSNPTQVYTPQSNQGFTNSLPPLNSLLTMSASRYDVPNSPATGYNFVDNTALAADYGHVNGSTAAGQLNSWFNT